MKENPQDLPNKTTGGFLKSLFADKSASESSLMLEPLEPRVLYSAAPVEPSVSDAASGPIEEADHVAPLNPDQGNAIAAPGNASASADPASSDPSVVVGPEEAVAELEAGEQTTPPSESDFLSASDKVTVSQIEDLAVAAAAHWSEAGLSEEQAAAHGTLSITGTGMSPTMTYVPNAEHDASDNFMVQVSDGTATARVAITVKLAEVDDPGFFAVYEAVLRSNEEGIEGMVRGGGAPLDDGDDDSFESIVAAEKMGLPGGAA